MKIEIKIRHVFAKQRQRDSISKSTLEILILLFFIRQSKIQVKTDDIPSNSMHPSNEFADKSKLRSSPKGRNKEAFSNQYLSLAWYSNHLGADESFKLEICLVLFRKRPVTWPVIGSQPTRSHSQQLLDSSSTHEGRRRSGSSLFNVRNALNSSKPLLSLSIQPPNAWIGCLCTKSNNQTQAKHLHNNLTILRI